MAVIVGLIFIALGLLGFLRWFPEFLLVIRGFGPLVLLTGGALALIVGLASHKSRRGDGKS